jgi:hypothetical protein
MRPENEERNRLAWEAYIADPTPGVGCTPHYLPMDEETLTDLLTQAREAHRASDKSVPGPRFVAQWLLGKHRP